MIVWCFTAAIWTFTLLWELYDEMCVAYSIRVCSDGGVGCRLKWLQNNWKDCIAEE